MVKNVDYAVIIALTSIVIGAIAYVNAESKVVVAHIAKPWHVEGGKLLKKQTTKLDDIADRTIRIEIRQQSQKESIEAGFEAIMEKLSG